MPIKCKIWYDVKIQAYRISTPYSQAFVDFLKIQIPASDRAFDPTSRIWTFNEKYFDPIRFMAEKVWAHSGETHVVDKQHAEAAARSNSTLTRRPEASLNESIVEFFRLIPYEAAKAAYRKAALEMHPDRNANDGERMSKLNAVWTRIEKELFTK
jgi:hypothetical protein